MFRVSFFDLFSPAYYMYPRASIMVIEPVALLTQRGGSPADQRPPDSQPPVPPRVPPEGPVNGIRQPAFDQRVIEQRAGQVESYLHLHGFSPSNQSEERRVGK